MDIISAKNLRKSILTACLLVAAAIIFFVVRSWIRIPGPPPAPIVEEMEISESKLPDGEPELFQSDFEVPPAKKEEYPKRVVIGLRSWSDVEVAKAIITESGGQIHTVLDWPTEKIISATVPDKDAEEKILKNSFWGKIFGGVGLTSFGNRLSGGIDYLVEDQPVYPNAIVNEGEQVIDWGVTQIQADKVWGTSRGKGVKVGILDTGIDPSHLDYKVNLKGGINFTTTISDGQVHPDQWNDDGGHGTLMAGIIAAADNGFGIVGVAPEADVYAIKTLGGSKTKGGTSGIISGIYWAADNGMDIINMSFATFDANSYWQEQYAKALDYASQRGVLPIGAAGNRGLEGGVIDWPAAYSRVVVTVSAMTRDGTLASFSSYGPAVELTAPGVQIISTDINRSGSSEVSGAGFYSARNGTSVAAPLVSGLAALVMAKDPQLTPQQIRSILDSTAIDLGEPGRDTSFGYGLINAYDSVLNLPPVIVSLTSPAGGELWYQGIDQKVEWTMETHGEIVDKIDIELIHQKSDNTIEVIPLVLGAENSGSGTVNVPKDLPESSKNDGYFLAVSCSKEYFGKCQHAESGWLNVKVLPSQKLTVLYPDGGEKWPQGTIQSVLWDANYFGGANIDIDIVERRQVPRYALRAQSGDWDNQVARWYENERKYWVWDNTQNYKTKFSQGHWSETLFDGAKDTCDGNIGTDMNNGIFVCPATSLSGAFSCVDIAKSKIYPNDHWKRNVTCEYGTTNIGIVAPTYSLVSQKRTKYDPSSGYSFGDPWQADVVGYVAYNPPYLTTIVSSPIPPDTCDQRYERWTYDTIGATCPATNTSEHLRCVDIFRGSNGTTPYQGYVDCTYRQTGSISVPAVFEDVSVASLAKNLFNGGSLEVSVPSELLGNTYRIQLGCSNFTGDCAKGLSAAPFSIIRLTDPRTLTIDKSGPGAVTDGNVQCVASRNSCEEKYEKGELVTLTASPADPSVIFTGWSGNSSCSSTGPCVLTMDADQSVTAKFTVRSVTVTATADRGSVFTGWSGNCLSSGQCYASWSSACPTDVPCNLTMSSDQEVAPTFISGPTLQLMKAGSGSGTVTGAQINCGAICESTYVQGDSESLTAIPDPNSTFVGWSEACSGTGTCNLIMDTDKLVTANFNAICTADTWSCDDWSTCTPNGTQTRSCTMTFDCPGISTQPPTTSQSCQYNLSPDRLRETRPGE